MTLEKTVRQKLSKWQHPGTGRQHCIVPDEGAGWVLTVAADRSDELGCLVWELTAQRSAPLAVDAAGLRAWADGVAARVTGLLEPLRVVEVDAPRLQAQLRSQNPIPRDEQSFYYEVILQAAGTALLRRYQAGQAGTPRAQAAFPLTHEALAKLAADLTGAP